MVKRRRVKCKYGRVEAGKRRNLCRKKPMTAKLRLALDRGHTAKVKGRTSGFKRQRRKDYVGYDTKR